jgi:hypothetical protein
MHTSGVPFSCLRIRHVAGQVAFGIAMTKRYGVVPGRLSRLEPVSLFDQRALWQAVDDASVDDASAVPKLLLLRCARGPATCSSQSRGCCQCSCGACANVEVRSSCSTWQEWPDEAGVPLCPLLERLATQEARRLPTVLSLQGFFRMCIL